MVTKVCILIEIPELSKLHRGLTVNMIITEKELKDL